MRRLLLIVCCLSLTFSTLGQTREELQRQRTLLQDQIDLANTILAKTQSTRQASINELQTLNQKIFAREQLIATMGRQIRNINRNITAKEKEIMALTARVDGLKTDYAELIQLAQRQQRPTDQILFILSSSFSQAAKRLQYFKDMAGFRAQQIAQIAEAQEALALEKDALIQQKAKKLAIQQAEQGEKLALQADANEQQTTVKELNSKESEIKNDIQKKQREVKQLEQQIKRIIAEEMRKAKERAERNKLEEGAKELGLIIGKDFSGRTSNKALKALIEKTRKEKGHGRS